MYNVWSLELYVWVLFIRPSRDGPYYVIGYGGLAGVHTGFRAITLVLYIGSLPNVATWFPCGRGRTLFILGSLPLYRLIIYIDGHILWCTHFLFKLVIFFVSIHMHLYWLRTNYRHFFLVFVRLFLCSPIDPFKRLMILSILIF